MTARLLEASDLSAVAELERLCFANPWSEHSLEILLRDGNFGAVATDGEERICAYVGAIVAVDEGEVTNVATHPDCRRRGCAEAALRFLIAEMATRGVSRVTLEVRESNLPARRLYEKLGFVSCGKRRNFYAAPREDAVVMERTVEAPSVSLSREDTGGTSER